MKQKKSYRYRRTPTGGRRNGQRKGCTGVPRRNGDGANKRTIRLFSASTATKSFGDNVSMPYIPYYLARLNASVGDMGIFQALQNLFPNIFQLPWGYMSDKVRRRIPFIVLGTLATSLTLLAILFTTSVPILILILSFNAIAISMISPTWSALLGDKVKHGRRGKTFSHITNFGLASGILGSIAVLFLFSLSPPKDYTAYRTPFLVGALFGLASIAFILPLRERCKAGKRVRLVKPSELGRDFRRFLGAQSAYNLFMSMGWPLFYISLANVLGATNVDIALLTFVSIAATIAFQPIVGRLIDLAGPTWLITLSRFLFICVPFVYGFATSLIHIYILNIFLGMASSIVNVAFNTYILDLSPPRAKAEYFAYYNLTTGIAAFAGSLMGGLLATYFQSLWPLATALFAVYIICGFGRTATAFLFLRLKDPKKYPSTPRQVAAAYIERIRGLVPRH